MKSVCKIWVIVTVAMYAFLELVVLIAFVGGREIFWFNETVLAAGFCGMTVIAMVFLCTAPQKRENTVLASVLLLLSLLMIFTLCSAVNYAWCYGAFAASIVAWVATMRSKALKIIGGVLFSLMFIVLFAASVIGALFTGLDEREVVRVLPSPDGQYSAEVVALSSGALGGDVLIEVHDTASQINLGVCRVEKPPKIAEQFPTYGSQESVEVMWLSKNTLQIHNTYTERVKEYTVAFE